MNKGVGSTSCTNNMRRLQHKTIKKMKRHFFLFRETIHANLLNLKTSLRLKTIHTTAYANIIMLKENKNMQGFCKRYIFVISTI